MNPKTYSVRFPAAQWTLWKDNQPLLSRLDMELTERCNNNCAHCYINLPANDEAAKKNELSLGEIKAILNEAASLGMLTVRFTGGEPLLRDDFEEIYLFARHLGLKVLISTNATLITPRLAALFHRTPPLEKIVVSVYGLDRNSYESISQNPGSFDAFERGINLLLNQSVPFVAQAALLPLDTADYKKFEEWARLIPWLDNPQASVLSLYLHCYGEDSARNKRILNFRLSPQKLLEIDARRPEEYLRGLREFCSRFCHISGNILFGCNAGIKKGAVDAYGNLQLCLMLRHPETVYNLRKGSLLDALKGFFPKVRTMKASNPRYIERCAKCFLRDLCEQCPAVSWMENQTLDGWLEYFCEFTHAQARLIGLLNEGERSWKVPDWEKRIKCMASGYNNIMQLSKVF